MYGKEIWGDILVMKDLKEQLLKIIKPLCEIWEDKPYACKTCVGCDRVIKSLTALFEKEIAVDRQERYADPQIQRDKIKALELQLAKAKAIIDQDYTAGRMTELEDKLAKAKEGLEKILNILTTFPFHSSDCVQVKDMVGIVKSIIKELSK
jgi:hypothetical protein